ncbi:uncharacterized protein LOC123541342 isoform X1 [Mercenaria mercenaria]|uniref:uncharacterized protein LOC123541342 isoform X1 n=1 Tax=Mercenaria mercenaria TaxID=6596 RepID=UPI00234F0677|nr:uncharacterized protein LOC123541342 isoform X1 [Mercenaria mercenaria]
MDKVCIVLLTLSVTDLMESASNGYVRSKSPSRRFIFDANHTFTGWASWQQQAACSILCVSGYETVTKQCCETGDNRLCYNLPWDKLKMYVGTCPNSTTLDTTVGSPTTTTTLKTTTTRRTRATTTIKLPKTLPPVTTTCAVCAGPKFLCEKLYAPTPCPPPNNYCINTITNHKDGTKISRQSMWKLRHML